MPSPMKLSRLIMIALAATTASMLVLMVKMFSLDTTDTAGLGKVMPQDAPFVEPDTLPVHLPDPPQYDSENRAVIPVRPPGMEWAPYVDSLVAANYGSLSAAGRPSSLTLVSALWDIGRGNMQTSEKWLVFKRPFSHYLTGAKAFLAYRFPKIVYCDEDSYAALKPLIEEADRAGAGPTTVIIKTMDDLKAEFKQFDRLDKIRASEAWQSQSAWIADSAQAQLPMYLPIVMSKLALARDAARWNPFKTDGFLWMDAGNICHDPQHLTPNREANILRYLGKLLTTTYSFSALTQEIKGFPRAAFNEYVGRAGSDPSPLTLAKGGILGGTRAYLEVAALAFSAVLDETLERGYLGTEENILSIVAARFPDLVRLFDNKDAGTCRVFKEFLMPPLDPKLDGYDLRGLQCRWVEQARSYVCFDGLTQCPPHVTPQFLDEAKNQAICTEQRNEYSCRLTCTRKEGGGEGGEAEATWFGSPCPQDGVTLCPPWPRTQLPGYDSAAPAPPSALHGPETGDKAAGAPAPAPVVQSGGLRADPFSGLGLLKAASEKDLVLIEKAGGFNLRGIACEINAENKERCFYEDAEGRDLCPERMSTVLLSAGDNEYLCMQDTHYCTVTCSGGDKISWHAHEIAWCTANKDNCPAKPPVVPVSEYKLGPWTQKYMTPMQCEVPANMPKFTVAVLAYKETEALSASFATYKAAKFLESVDEKILYLNARNDEMDSFAAPFAAPPYNVRVLGNSQNYGIATALNWLFGNSTNEYVLFLEKDFQLVESLDCVKQQLAEGVRLLEDGTAHVVRFRSRHNPGRPNWARILYAGHEDDVFKSQPNLLCNFFHWIDSPDKRWPKEFYPCGAGKVSDGDGDRSKVFYCSKAYYCNWTNNPFLISKTWWREQYETKFAAFKNVNPYDDLELYMNWEPNSWNDRPWIVAQGEGVFKHVDKKKWG